MADTLSLRGLVLTTLGGLAVVSAQKIPSGILPYPVDKPYQEKAKDNGLAVEKPNIIIFMPDQLRLDSVGAFGSDVSIRLCASPAKNNHILLLTNTKRPFKDRQDAKH